MGTKPIRFYVSLVMLLLTGLPTQALAIAAADRNAVVNDTVFYDPKDYSTCGPSTATGPIIILDPGHSGTDISRIDPATGIQDHDYPNHPEMEDVYAVALAVQTKLTADGYQVTMTKSTPTASVYLRDRAEIANSATAALGVSIHDQATPTSGAAGAQLFANQNNLVYAQKVGLYRQKPDGTKVTFTDATVAAASQKYTALFAQERTIAEKHSVTEATANIDGRAGLAPGNIWLTQLFSKVPWVYSEAGGNSAGQGGLSAADQQLYATGLINGIEKSVPPPAPAAGCCGSTVTGSGGSLTGADNREKIWNWLRAKGLSAEQAAGVVGNMAAEAGFNPARNQGDVLGAHAWGLAQWDFGRRDALVSAVKANSTTAPLYSMSYAGGTDVSTGYVPAGMSIAQNDALILLELNFLYQESTNRGVTATGFGTGANEWAVMLQQTTIDNATVFWHNNFEVSADSPAQVLANRGGAAHAAYDAYAKGGPVGPGGTCNNTTSASCIGASSPTLIKFCQTVVDYAWPDYKGSPFIQFMPKFAVAVKNDQSAGHYVGSPAGIDCGGFVSMLMVDSGYEPKYNAQMGNTVTQAAWAKANWQDLGPASAINPATLQAGDVAISSEHTFVWVGKITGFNATIASASQGDRSPMADTAQSPTEGGFEWFRKK